MLVAWRGFARDYVSSRRVGGKPDAGGRVGWVMKVGLVCAATQCWLSGAREEREFTRCLEVVYWKYCRLGGKAWRGMPVPPLRCALWVMLVKNSAAQRREWEWPFTVLEVASTELFWWCAGGSRGCSGKR